MKLGQPLDLFAHIHKRAGDVLVIVASEGAVGGERLVQLSEQALIIYDETKLLLLSVILKETIDAGDRLQESVVPQGLADIEHRVARRIEPCKQLRPRRGRPD